MASFEEGWEVESSSMSTKKGNRILVRSRLSQTTWTWSQASTCAKHDVSSSGCLEDGALSWSSWEMLCSISLGEESECRSKGPDESCSQDARHLLSVVNVGLGATCAETLWGTPGKRDPR